MNVFEGHELCGKDTGELRIDAGILSPCLGPLMTNHLLDASYGYLSLMAKSASALSGRRNRIEAWHQQSSHMYLTTRHEQTQRLAAPLKSILFPEGGSIYHCGRWRYRNRYLKAVPHYLHYPQYRLNRSTARRTHTTSQTQLEEEIVHKLMNIGRWKTNEHTQAEELTSLLLVSSRVVMWIHSDIWPCLIIVICDLLAVP